MTLKEWKKVARILKEAYKEVESEALSAGVDIFSDEYKAGLEKIREKILAELGFTFEEYQEMYGEFTKARKKDVDKKLAEVSERIDKLPELPEVPTKEQIKELAEEVAEEVVKRNLKPPQITNQIVKEITKEVIKEEPKIIETVRVEKVEEKYDDKKLLKELAKLESKIAEIVIPDKEEIKEELSEELSKDLQKNIDILGMPDFRKMGMGLQAQIDDLKSGGGGGHTIQDEGVGLTQRTNLNFVGDGVTATDDAVNDATVVTIPETDISGKADVDLGNLVNPVVNTDIDFAGYKAIAMACDNGATMPTTPSEGQWFLQVATGRKILWQYVNSTWNPLFGFGDITFYVDGTNGTDSLDKGTGTTTNAFKTIQYAIDAIPPLFNGNVVVNVAAGTYTLTSAISVGGKVSTTGSGTITVQGVALGDIAPDLSLTADSWTRGYYGSSPNYAKPAELTDTGAFVAAAQEGKWFNKTGSTDYRIIYKNTADKLYIMDGVNTTCTTYEVRSLTTTITNSGSATTNVVEIKPGQMGVYVKYFNLTSTGSGQVIKGEYGSEYYFYYCKITPGTGTQNITTQYCVASFYYCTLYQTNGVATLGVNLGAILRLWGTLLRWTSSSGYGIRNIGAFINMAELTTFYGASTAIEKPGIVLSNGGFCTIFQNYFDVGYGVVCDGVSWLGIQSEYYAGWAAAVTTQIYKPLDARSAEIRILTDLAVEKETMGYDASGDYLYDELTEVKRIGTPASDYTQFDTTGHQTMAGTAKPWNDIRVEPVARTTGSNAPTFRQWFDDSGIGDTGTTRGVYLYEFDNATAGSEKEVFFTLQMDHAWDGGPIHLHVHWIAESTAASSKVRWGLEYTMAEPNATFGATAAISYADTPESGDTGTTAGKHQITEFTAITPSATQDGLSSILIGRIFRDSANGADTYTGDAGLLYIDAHYQLARLGSTDEYTA